MKIRASLAVIVSTVLAACAAPSESEPQEEVSEELKAPPRYPARFASKTTGFVPGQGSASEASLGITKWKLDFGEGLDANVWHYRTVGINSERKVVYDVSQRLMMGANGRHLVDIKYAVRPRIPVSQEKAIREQARISVQAKYLKIHRAKAGVAAKPASIAVDTREGEDLPVLEADALSDAPPPFDRTGFENEGAPFTLDQASYGGRSAGTSGLRPQALGDGRCNPLEPRLPGANCVLAVLGAALVASAVCGPGAPGCVAGTLILTCFEPILNLISETTSDDCSGAPPGTAVVRYICGEAHSGDGLGYRLYPDGPDGLPPDSGGDIYYQYVPTSTQRIARWTDKVCSFGDGGTTAGCVGRSGINATLADGSVQPVTLCSTPIVLNPPAAAPIIIGYSNSTVFAGGY